MKEEAFEQFAERLRDRVTPFSVVLELTNLCNLGCVHCYRGADGPELSTREILRILDEIADSGCLKLTLTGGEPSLRADLPVILEACRKRHFAVTLFTNATRISPELAAALSAGPLLAVETSLYGADAGSHEAVTGVPGSFQQTLENIGRLIGLGLRVVIKSVIMDLNRAQLEPLKRLAMECGAGFQPTFRVFSSYHPQRQPERHRLRDSDLRDLTELVRTWQHGDRPPPPRQPHEPFLCHAGRDSCCIGFDGTVYPCTALRQPCGDLRDSSFEKIWHGSETLQTLRSYGQEDFVRCHACAWKERCDFCPALGFAEHGDILEPSEELCRLTRTRTGSKNMIDRLRRTLAPPPQEFRRFRMHGIDLEITSNSPRILDTIEELLEPFRTDAHWGNQNPLRFQLDHRPRPDPSLLQEITRDGRLIFDSARDPAAMDDWGAHFQLKYYVSDGIHLADYGDIGVVVTDVAGGRALGFLADPDSIESYVLSKFIFFLSLYETTRYRDHFFIHAAGLRKNGIGLLVPGPSGSGKSTLTVALIRAGFEFLSDDRVLLQRRFSGISALAFPEKIDVTDQTLGFFEELLPLRTQPADPAGRKKNFPIEAYYPGLTVSQCRPGVILLPTLTDGRTSRIEPIDRTRATTMLLPQGLLVLDPGTAERHFQLLCDLVKQCGCYRIHFARDFSAVPRLVEAIL